MTFAVTMITIDRGPRKNYLEETLANLKRSGVFRSPLLHSFRLCVSRSRDREFAEDAWRQAETGFPAIVDAADRTPTENASHALRQAADASADSWSLFLEDDIDVCADFLESADRWLTRHQYTARVFPLGANYDFITNLWKSGCDYWKYPVGDFYGTLALAMRSDDARSIADFLDTRAVKPEYDIHMHDWAQQNGISHFRTPAPSFVQHIGGESVIRPGSDPIVYQTWAGREWSYQDLVCEDAL